MTYILTCLSALWQFLPSEKCFDDARKLRRDAENFWWTSSTTKRRGTVVNPILYHSYTTTLTYPGLSKGSDQPEVGSIFIKEHVSTKRARERDRYRNVIGCLKAQRSRTCFLGKLLRKLGRCDDAVSHLERAIQINSKRIRNSNLNWCCDEMFAETCGYSSRARSQARDPSIFRERPESQLRCCCARGRISHFSTIEYNRSKTKYRYLEDITHSTPYGHKLLVYVVFSNTQRPTKTQTISTLQHQHRYKHEYTSHWTNSTKPSPSRDVPETWRMISTRCFENQDILP